MVSLIEFPGPAAGRLTGLNRVSGVILILLTPKKGVFSNEISKNGLRCKEQSM